MEDCVLSVTEQVPLIHDDGDENKKLQNIDMDTENFPKSQARENDTVLNNVDPDSLKTGDLKARGEIKTEANENGNSYDCGSDIPSVISMDETGCLNEVNETGDCDGIKSESFENSHVIVLNKHNARTRIKRCTLRHECDRCEEAFQFPYQLARHKSIKHDGKYPFFCTVCKKPFDRSSSLRDHMLVHSESRPHECKQCGKSFKMSGNLKKHIRDIHTQKEEPKLVFQCEYCSKTFPSKERLTSHFIVHDTEKAFACNICGKRFNRKHNLKEHVVIHSTEKKFVCPECGMRFNRKYSLKIHARNHLEVKPYKCELCPASFSQLHALKSHFRLHTGEKPFKCKICEKSFSQLSTLQVHLKRHTEVKDFICRICGKGFIIKRRLIEHERLHTGEKPFSCDICPYHAATSSGLRLHKKTHRRQMESLGISSTEHLLKYGKQNISADGRKRKVSKKAKLSKQPVTLLKEKTAQEEDMGAEKCFTDKADVNLTDMVEIEDKIVSESQSTTEEITFVQSGHVIEIVNDDMSTLNYTASSQLDVDCDDDKNVDKNDDIDDNHLPSNEKESVVKGAQNMDFEKISKEVLYKYLNELIPSVDADLLDEKIKSIVEELSEHHTTILKEKSIMNSKKIKKTKKTSDNVTSDITGKTNVSYNREHISAPAEELSHLKTQSLPISDPIFPEINVTSSPSLNVLSTPLVNANILPSVNANSMSALNISGPPFKDFNGISKQTVNAGTKDQGNSNGMKSVILRQMLGSKVTTTTQGYVARKEIKPICTYTGSSFTVLKDMLSSPPQHYLISTRNSSASLKHSIKRQKQIAASNNGFEGKWHTPGSSMSESDFTWIDEIEYKPDVIKISNIKMEPVSP